MPLNTELVDTLLQPIPGDNPCGKDLRYDPRMDAVKEARREDLDLPQGGLVTDRKVADWNAVINVSTALLSKETKDLQLFVWLAEALLHKQGFSGFATGIDAVRGLLAQYWEGLYPQPEEDDLELRIGPLEWLGSAKLGVMVRLSAVAQNGMSLDAYNASRSIPTEAEGADNREKRDLRTEAEAQGKLFPEVADAAIEATGKAFYKTLNADLDLTIATLNALEKVSDERFGRDAPAFNPLRNSLDELRRYTGSVLARKLELDPDPIEEVPEPGEGGFTEEGPITAEPANRNDANNRVAIVARWFRQQDPMSPAPYLMLRGFRWGELRAAAPELNPRLLEAPPTAIRARLKGLMIDGRWSDLLEQGEQLMATAQGRGWLDLQRYTLTACTNLGSAYNAVAVAIRSELRALLVALPQLPEMTLMDDTPTANGETQEWLKAEGLTGTPDAPAADELQSTEDTPGDDGSAALDNALAEDDATSQQGGLARPAARRRAPTPPAGNTPRDPFDSARSELAQGRPHRAIELLVAELARERSPRGRFVRQTQMAWIMVEGGLESVAKPILERLIETISERSLEEWEAGPLVAQPLALLHRVLERQGIDEDTRADLYLRVCRLDPMQAIALRPGH